MHARGDHGPHGAGPRAHGRKSFRHKKAGNAKLSSASVLILLCFGLYLTDAAVFVILSAIMSSSKERRCYIYIYIYIYIYTYIHKYIYTLHTYIRAQILVHGWAEGCV